MKPTQAQIEAARQKVIDTSDTFNRHNVERAQLRANPDILYRDYMDTDERKLDEAFQELFVLTAAAEAGAGEQSIVARTPMMDAETSVIVGANIRNATIERCAQVVNNYLIQFQKDFAPHERVDATFIVGRLAALVAAIRAMKEQP